MKRRPWPLPRLLAANHNTITVYAALRWLSGEKRQLNTTRQRIAEVCGLHEDTITAAIRTLADAHWIALNYGRAGHRIWYRLSFPVAGFFPVAVQTGLRDGSSGGQNRPQGTVPCGRSNRPHPLKGIGAVPAAAPSPLSGGASAPAPNLREHPAAKIERERMKAIQEARLAQQRQEEATRGA